MYDKLIFETSKKGKRGVRLPRLDVPRKNDLIPTDLKRKNPVGLPEVSEPEVVRHFVNLSNKNHHIDRGFYPLGSCTMKYNPKINEQTCRLSGFTGLHPFQDENHAQGALKLMVELGGMLTEITGMDGVTLQPAAGAHGELTGLLIMRAYHESKGEPRRKVIIPDSAHGTNPASIITAGYDVVQIPSGEDGLIDLDRLRKALDEQVAAMMITNPNTLGLFESQVLEIAEAVHKVGALLYMDGANLNALLGIAKPGDMNFDVVHLNLHKTFSTPHGGGGPGSGPVVVKKHLVPFLPEPIPQRSGDGFRWADHSQRSIGRIGSFYGNFGVFVRAYTYILMMGAQGLRKVSENALINANYLKRLLEPHYDLPYNRTPLHEAVFSGDCLKEFGVKTTDVAKRLLDYGFHAPTIYFPLIVHEALMIEPTETESKDALDAFADAMIMIMEEARDNSDLLKGAPYTTPVGRLNEAAAARALDVNYYNRKTSTD
ncbi:glycine dehydrogenase (aminomethyl-transferring) [candidate division LCP-89 bacterium B3_LCP]|uniref:Probable glycine dehydrogenase (decarboxylating) subunit 2 n=1 Tax=candidate division LCP-89 bacterium B3_LCP TaxID=2012998 RepID=A0A532V1C4_UNCL8|nr:MAG: glycine dehydrogenase (aminomethyl-transferring) [candidate division LCP-89 bacterium B3_LCP]